MKVIKKYTRNLLEDKFLILSVIVIMLSSVFLTGCEKEYKNSTDDPQEIANLPEFSNKYIKQNIEKNIKILADDKMEGRAIGEVGYDRAADYVVDVLKKNNIASGNGDEYFQAVTLVKSVVLDSQFSIYSLKKADTSDHNSITSDHNSMSQAIMKTENMQFKYIDDFISYPTYNLQEQQIKAELVFVGYGISSDFHHYNDYENIDVNGKIAVMFTGGPKNWLPDESAYLQHSSTKIATAQEKGAVGVVFLYAAPRLKQAPFKNYQKKPKREFFNWVDKEKTRFSKNKELKMVALVEPSKNSQFFDKSIVNYKLLQKLADEQEELSSFALDKFADLRIKNSVQYLASKNIVAVIEGQDKVLKDEYLVLTAHLDHLGKEEIISKKTGKKITKIYNGAMDNAMGVSMMLTVAKMIKKAPFKRSVIILAVTAEEKGLRGSDYFVHYPVVPMDNIIANINLDMPLVLYDFTDVIAFGAKHSSLYNNLKKVATQMGVKVSPDPVPELAIFTRSDHFSFVKQGKPSLFLFPGFKNGGREQFESFMKNHYHRESDNLDLPINYNAAAKFTLIKYKLARDIANSHSHPVWNEDSFFKTMQNKNRKKR